MKIKAVNHDYTKGYTDALDKVVKVIEVLEKQPERIVPEQAVMKDILRSIFLIKIDTLSRAEKSA